MVYASRRRRLERHGFQSARSQAQVLGKVIELRRVEVRRARCLLDEVHQVAQEKVRDYLLSRSHPIGRFKEAFFSALGYSGAEWERLRDDLLAVARSGLAVVVASTAYGAKYEVRATLMGPSGRAAEIVSVWIVRNGEDFPRFVTAYPA